MATPSELIERKTCASANEHSQLCLRRLAHREEREVEAELGDRWRAYAAVTPRWLPRLRTGQPHATTGPSL